MRLIDADELKKQILIYCLYLAVTGDITDKHIVNLFTEAFVKIIDKAPSVPHYYDCNHDCDAIYKAYQKGREDALKEIKKRTDTILCCVLYLSELSRQDTT